MNEMPEAGWWPDPAGSGKLRYWDGQSWTAQLRDAPAELGQGGDPQATETALALAPPTTPGAVVPVDAPPERPRRAWLGPVLIAAAAVAVLGLLVGSFFLGQGTRKPDDQIAAEKRAAVVSAIALTRREDAAEQARVVKRVREKQKRRMRVVVRRVVRKLKRSSARRAAASYANGSAAGFTNGRAQGYDAGTQDGAREATDQVVCSDDPDVTWLPYC